MPINPLRAAPLLLALLLAGLLLHPVAARADEATATPASGVVLVVGTKEAPPFVMKGPDGNWTGISIDLWQRIADELKFGFRLEAVATVPELIDGAAGHRFDAAIAAITITADRAQVVDFSQPFYDTGLGIAVPIAAPARWAVIQNTILSLGFLQAVGALIGLTLLVGVLIWLLERRRNEHFGGVLSGITASIWWSAEAMTQASTGHRAPITLAGRTLAVLWMVVSIIAIAVFTAGVTSALTTRTLQGLVNSPDDLRSARVGAVTGSATIDYLDKERLRHLGFASPHDGLEALRAGRIDAFVYDKPLLSWMVMQDYSYSIQVLDDVFDPQNYGIALPPGSPLRKSIDIALLDIIESPWWKETLFRYLGQR